MSRRRRILLAALAALAILVAFAPFLARTDAARRFVAGRVSKALGRPVEIESLDAGWTSGVTLTGLVVRNGDAEFRGAPLLEARSVRLENALPSLVLSGATSVAIDGLKVRIEEHAGGRTNVDDLVKGLATPRRRVEKREVRPFRIALNGASIQVRRLVRRPQPRPVDPFREDPVILDANEGLIAFGLDGDLRLETTPESTTFHLSADITGGRRGRAEIALTLLPRGPHGVVRLEGIDLQLLDPFVKGIAGRIELRAEGSPDGAKLKLRAEGLKAPRIDEAWAELSLDVRRDGDGVAFDDVSLRTASGAFALDGKAAWPPRGVDLVATLAAEPLGPVRVEVTGGPELAATVTATRSTVSLRGRSLDALSGTADVDLADVNPFLREGSLAGRLTVARFSLDGRSIAADATLAGLVAKGLFADDLVIDRGELHVEAVLSEDGDSVVGRAQLDDLAVTGSVSGLRTGKFRGEGLLVEGTLALNPLHARLLGIEDVRGLRGQLTVEVATDGKRVEGKAAVEGFRLETPRGTWELARMSAQGLYDGKAGFANALGDGFRLECSLDERKASVELDVEAIERQPLLSASGVSGPVKLRAEVTRGPLSIRGTVESAGLSAKGIDAGQVRATFTAREEDRGWLVTAPEVVLTGLGVKASVGEGFLGRDGTGALRVTAEGPIDRIATLLEGAAPYAPEGRLTVALDATYGGRWSFAGEAHADDLSVVVSGERTPKRSVVVGFDASPSEDGSVVFRKLSVAGQATELEGQATFGRAISLRMTGRTRLEEIAPYAPMFEGSGEVVLDEVALDLDGEGRLEASARMRAESVRVEGGRLQKAAVRSRVVGRLVRGSLEEVETDLFLTAARAVRGNILAEGLALAEKGAGRSGAYSLGTRVESGRLTVGATSWEQVSLDVTGRLDRLLAERPPTGVRGTVSFARWRLGPFLWEDAKGDVFLDKGIVVVRDLVAGLHGGTVRAQGRLTPVGDRLSWEAEADAKGILLSEEIGKPLSFVVPFLRVEKEAGKLAGRADLDLKLSADDTTDAAILRTLLGAGKAHLYDIEASNSILLPLLSLRLDKAILREPFRFKDLEVAFSVGKGAIRSEPFELEATPFGIKVKEAEVTLDGKVNVLVIPGIVPLRVKGTLDDPEVRPAPLAPFR